MTGADRLLTGDVSQFREASSYAHRRYGLLANEKLVLTEQLWSTADDDFARQLVARLVDLLALLAEAGAARDHASALEFATKDARGWSIGPEALPLAQTVAAMSAATISREPLRGRRRR